EQSNLILEEDDEPSLLMTTHETEQEEVLLNKGQIQPGKYASGDASMWYLDNDDCTRFMWAYFLTSKDQALSTFKEFRQQIEMEMRMKLRMLRTDRGGVEEGLKACRLYDPVAKNKHVSKDVRFMKTKPWNWDKDEANTSTQDTFWTNFVIEGIDNEIDTLVNTDINGDDDTTYQEPDTIPDPVSPITPPTYTYNPHSDEEVEATISSIENSGKGFDHVPVRGFKKLADIYQNTQEVETNTLLLTEEEPLNQKAIGLKWVFKTKRDARGNIIKYKARLVAKGYV
nr:zinc finger, CCHC-type [Tanacetum cinerariifolium]